MDMIKKNLNWLLCAALGVLQFILFAIPYFAVFVDAGTFGSQSENFSGYTVIDLMGDDKWEEFSGFGSVMSSITQILILITGIVLLAIGAIGLLKEFANVDITDMLGNLNLKKVSEYGIYAYGGLNVLLLIFMIIFTASNTESFGGYTLGIRFSAGLFITLVIAGAAIFALVYIPKKFPVDENAPSVTYVCGQCGKKANAKSQFCNVCGGQILAKAAEPKMIYVCGQCGKKSSAKNKFCNVCGGQIVAKLPEPKPVYVCSGCGKSAKASEKFCSVCGGAIEAKVPETTVNE